MKRVTAVFAKPQKLVHLSGLSVSFEDDTHRPSRSLWGVGSTGRQEKHFALPDVNGLWTAIRVNYFYLNVALHLIEQFFSFFPVVIFSSVWAADDHHDEIVIPDIDLFVTDGRLKQEAVIFNPSLEVEGFGDWHSRKFIGWGGEQI